MADNAELERMLPEAAPPRHKCCKKCAFRPNSPERCDPYGWMRKIEQWQDGVPFFCHEGVRGHRQQIDGAPLRMCRGWETFKQVGFEKAFALAHCDDRIPASKFS